MDGFIRQGQEDCWESSGWLSQGYGVSFGGDSTAEPQTMICSSSPDGEQADSKCNESFIFFLFFLIRQC